MANKPTEQSRMTEPISPRININEILMSSGLSVMQKAGFRAYMDGVQHMNKNRWEQKISEYLKR